MGMETGPTWTAGKKNHQKQQCLVPLEGPREKDGKRRKGGGAETALTWLKGLDSYSGISSWPSKTPGAAANLEVFRERQAEWFLDLRKPST